MGESLPPPSTVPLHVCFLAISYVNEGVHVSAGADMKTTNFSLMLAAVLMLCVQVCCVPHAIAGCVLCADSPQ